MNTKEEFCGSCVVVPLAFAGSGLTLYGTSNTTGSTKKYKKIILISGVVSIIIGLLMYYVAIRKKCNYGNTCRL
jgi:hypothetical protein